MFVLCAERVPRLTTRPGQPTHPQIAPATATMDGLSSRFAMDLQPWSVNILQLHLGTSPSGAASALRRGAGAGAGGATAAA